MGRVTLLDASCRGPLEVHFDLLERLALCLRKEERCNNKVEDGAERPEGEHREVSVATDHRQKYARNQCGCPLVQQKSDAHTCGTDPCRHEFGERKPDHN